MGQGSFFLYNIKLIHRKFAKIKTYNAIWLVQTFKFFDKSEFNSVLGHSKGQLYHWMRLLLKKYIMQTRVLCHIA